MPVVNVNLLVDDKTYAAVKAGTAELCGLAKNIDNKRIIKHIPTVTDAAKEGASKAIDFIREHKKGTVAIGGILIIGSAIIGIMRYISSKNKRKLEANFAEALQVYLDAAQNGSLSIGIIDTLIISIDALVKNNSSENVTLNISVSQFSELVNCLFDFTKRLAEANNISSEFINRPRVFKKKGYSDLQYYLNVQKDIFEKAA